MRLRFEIDDGLRLQRVVALGLLRRVWKLLRKTARKRLVLVLHEDAWSRNAFGNMVGCLLRVHGGLEDAVFPQLGHGAELGVSLVVRGGRREALTQVFL